MAVAAVSFAAETIGNLLIEETKFLQGVSDQVEQLQLELKRMQSFLKDADARQHEEERVKVWISQARDLAYEADDLIERYAFKVASRRRKGIRGITKRCVGILNECYARHTTKTGIQTLKTKISDLTKSFQEYGIAAVMERQDGASSSSHQQLRRTYSHVVEDDFVGLEDDVEMLVKHLLRGSDHDHAIDQHFRVVSICGMGGLGKTTLARKVYNHPELRRCFDGLAWVCVSQKWQKEDILQRILLSLIPEKRKEILEWRDEELVRQLFQILQNKKCLVVLDDIWATEPWECIKQAFPIRNDGSKILVTSRNKDVALHIDPSGFHHQPRFLSEDESWQLLQRKALRGRFHGEHEDFKKLENLGKEMVKACGGLPLAVIVLSGTLATKKDLNEWATVNRNIKAHLGRGNNLIKEEGNLHKILALSYNDLPYKLKPCFLYLSRYEEDSDIGTEKLYQLWIAEGIISTKDQIGEESMMDVAERYLGELVTRCMVQGKAPDDDDVMLSSVGRSFASCRLHDLMRDLSLLKAKEENFLLSISHYHDGILDEHGNNDHSQVYRLAVHFSKEDVRKYVPPAEKRNTRHLRSLALLLLGNEFYEGRLPKKMKSQFNRFKMLRVLTIEGIRPAFSEDHILKTVFLLVADHLRLPKAVGELIHLRYLSLRNSVFVCLPSSLGNLQNLQTLDLRAGVCRIPNVLWKMRQLRHLYLPANYADRMVGKFSLNLCCKNLRLKGLDKLEILENFCPPTCSSQDISTLKNLRVLSAVVFMGNFDDEYFPVEIHRLMANSDHVRCTSLRIYSAASAASNKEKLSDAVGQCFSSRNLQVLEVYGPLANFPKHEAQYMYASLLKLKLTTMEIEEYSMETLERLPNLRSLHLQDLYILGKEMRCKATGFGQLRFLRFEFLRNLEKWNVDEGAMPNLSVLTIVYCTKLEMVPNGLRYVKTLKELNIASMPKEFTDRIQAVNGEDKGQDFDKVSHIPTISVRDILS
ncbi:putative disease resistance protein At1g50180 [Coffea arabica]|uniref:Disease resistance protein At1g50180 n=1 Tax=Coffea arabica TaxID=13443 RepID=A0A6P6SLF8_COFAR|nr:probable disease resistance protein At1g58602 [Coffea arabica]XP_027066488.1 probable disease resistance protein At1g58602 [Coffea arabica]